MPLPSKSEDTATALGDENVGGGNVTVAPARTKSTSANATMATPLPPPRPPGRTPSQAHHLRGGDGLEAQTVGRRLYARSRSDDMGLVPSAGASDAGATSESDLADGVGGLTARGPGAGDMRDGSSELLNTMTRAGGAVVTLVLVLVLLRLFISLRWPESDEDRRKGEDTPRHKQAGMRVPLLRSALRMVSRACAGLETVAQAGKQQLVRFRWAGQLVESTPWPLPRRRPVSLPGGSNVPGRACARRSGAASAAHKRAVASAALLRDRPKHALRRCHSLQPAKVGRPDERAAEKLHGTPERVESGTVGVPSRTPAAETEMCEMSVSSGLPKLLGSTSDPPSVLSSAQVALVHRALPPRIRIRDWALLYSTEQHGCSLRTAYHRCERQGATVLLVLDGQGSIFGAFSGDSWRDVGGKHYHGNGETFLFKVRLGVPRPPPTSPDLSRRIFQRFYI